LKVKLAVITLCNHWIS